jgi:hypothetical protein
MNTFKKKYIVHLIPLPLMLKNNHHYHQSLRNLSQNLMNDLDLLTLNINDLDLF